MSEWRPLLQRLAKVVQEEPDLVLNDDLFDMACQVCASDRGAPF
jgi:hypothetical protein